MKFLADESCDHLFVRSLRDENHHVTSVAEDFPGIEDELVAERALEEDRILLTEDRDFGHYVFARSRRQVGIVLLRYPFEARARLLKQIKELIGSEAENLEGKFTVIEPGRNRIRKLP